MKGAGGMKRKGHRLIENMVNISQDHMMCVYKILLGMAGVGK